MKSISRYSGELQPQARDTADAEWADCWAEEMTQGLKAFATNPADLNFMPRAYMVKGEN